MTEITGYDLTHKKIMDSGKVNFLNDGYERANLRKICKDAGVTTGAFYRHFNDKEDLFISLVDPLAKELLGFYNKFEEESFQNIEKNCDSHSKIYSSVYSFSMYNLYLTLYLKLNIIIAI